MNPNNFRYKLAQFFQGRTGVDNLGRLFCWLSIICLLLTTITHSTVIYLAGLLFIGYSLWRMLNKNYQKRYQENQYYLNKTIKIRHTLDSLIRNIRISAFKFTNDIKLRKDYKYFTCPSCHQKLRAPRGKGRIEVTCRKCNHVFIKKV